MQIANSRYSVATLLSRAIPTFLRRQRVDHISTPAPAPASPEPIDPSTRALFANGPLPSNFSINLGVARAADPDNYPAHFFVDGQKVCVRLWRPEKPANEEDLV
jgi:hypothetical protein